MRVVKKDTNHQSNNSNKTSKNKTPNGSQMRPPTNVRGSAKKIYSK